jgi:tetratricopeptide (TPR) repeat protein
VSRARRSRARGGPAAAAALALLWWGGAGAALARQDDPRLPDLFAALKAAPGPAEAAPLEARIWSIWAETPDPRDAALYARAEAAIARRDHLGAIQALDELTAKAPDFAEAWNKRATAHYLAGNHRASVEDIRRTLALEPRHFGALSGLGLIYAVVGEPRAAVRSFEAALAIHPHLPGAKAHIRMLEGELEGAPL